MKHGDKAKAKSAKAKASGKKSASEKGVSKSSKGAEKSKAGRASSKKSSKAPEKVSDTKADNGKGKPARSAEAVSFTNPVVAAAFKRAVKKYPTAFRRLTD